MPVMAETPACVDGPASAFMAGVTAVSTSYALTHSTSFSMGIARTVSDGATTSVYRAILERPKTTLTVII